MVFYHKISVKRKIKSLDDKDLEATNYTEFMRDIYEKLTY